MQFQRRDGLWEELSEENPAPVWIVNPMQPKTIQVTVDERGDVVVTNLSELDAKIQPLLEQLGELGATTGNIEKILATGLGVMSDVVNESRIGVELICAEYASQVGRLNTYAKWLFVVQSAIALFSLAALVVAIVR
jgi:hypothetical protein